MWITTNVSVRNAQPVEVLRDCQECGNHYIRDTMILEGEFWVRSQDLPQRTITVGDAQSGRPYNEETVVKELDVYRCYNMLAHEPTEGYRLFNAHSERTGHIQASRFEPIPEKSDARE